VVDVSQDLILRKMDEAWRIFCGYYYMYLARPFLERKKFGMDGEVAIRRGLRAYGNIRGKWMRKWHTEEGLPIDVESIVRQWDSSSVILLEKQHGSISRESECKPYHVYEKFAPCSIHDVWKEEGFEREGYMYCDELHQELAMGYHPNASVEIHQNLNKGDPYCDFTWTMPRESPEEEIDRSGYEKMQRRMREEPEQELLGSLKRQTRCDALLHSCLADSLIRQFGDRGEKLVRKALRELGSKEAERVKDKLKNAGKKLTPRNVLEGFDLAYGLLWKVNVDVSDGVYKADVEYCPFAEVWKELNHEKLGLIYCEEMYGATFRHLAKAANARVTKCMMSGDSKCRLEFKM